MQQLKADEDRRRAEEAERKKREKQKRKDQEYEKRTKRDEEERIKRQKEEERQRKENKIKSFRNSQDIGFFLDLLIDFKYESSYLEKTIEALNEDTIIEKFGKMSINSGEKIQIINETIFERQDNIEKISDKCIRKLRIIVF